MSIHEEVKNTSKEFLSKIIPEDNFQGLVTDETLNKILETEDIKKIFEDYAETNKMPTKETRKSFLSGVELGINLGFRYGVLSLAELVVEDIYDIPKNDILGSDFLNEASEEDK